MGRPNLAVLGLDDHVFTFSPLYLSLYPFCIFASFYVVLSSKNIVYEQLLQVWVPTGTRIWINKGRGRRNTKYSESSLYLYYSVTEPFLKRTVPGFKGGPYPQYGD